MENFAVSPAPHCKTQDTARLIMLDMIIALLPALVAGTYFFGYRAAVVVVISLVSTMLLERIGCMVLRRRPAKDLSAVAAGLIMAFCLPATVPLWLPAVGGLVMACCKLFAKNRVNPPAAAVFTLLLIWPAAMAAIPPVFPKLGLIDASFTTAASQTASYFDLFLGQVSGCIGEVSTVALLLGGVYLIFRRVIEWQIPVGFLAAVALMTLLFGNDLLYQLMSGGTLLAAIFVAPYYAGTPAGRIGQLIYGVCCGILTVAFRLWGAPPFGFCLAILLMNIASPFINNAGASPLLQQKEVRENAMTRKRGSR